MRPGTLTHGPTPHPIQMSGLEIIQNGEHTYPHVPSEAPVPGWDEEEEAEGTFRPKPLPRGTSSHNIKTRTRSSGLNLSICIRTDYLQLEP